MKTYLVTGGAGFIGSNYIHYILEQQGVRVINYDALTYAGNLKALEDVSYYPEYTFIHGDICYQQQVEKVFQDYDIDYVVHFAAESHVDRSISNPNIFVQTNILGTQTLLEVARKSWTTKEGFLPGKKFLHISTDEVYGTLGDEGYFTEESPLDAHSPYAASKAGADLLVKSYYDTYGFPMNITRCSNNYGPHQYPEKLIPYMIYQALENKVLPIYGDGKNIRDWIYVEDHCQGIDAVLNQGKVGEIYNLGGQCEIANRHLVEKIISELKRLLCKQPEFQHIDIKLITYVEDRKGHDYRYAMDISKIQKELQWSPRTSFQQGLLKTIEWYVDSYLLQR